MAQFIPRCFPSFLANVLSDFSMNHGKSSITNDSAMGTGIVGSETLLVSCLPRVQMNVWVEASACSNSTLRVEAENRITLSNDFLMVFA